MKTLSWIVAVAVFVLFFALYSFRLGAKPALWHDDFEYTYLAFSLVEHGSFGSPLLGTGLDVDKRNYSLIVYYYASVHSVLIRLFGDRVESIPLANTFHFALLAAAGCFFLLRRRAPLGALVFLSALVADDRIVDAARHGRPEMTAGFYLTLVVAGLWLWLGGECRRPSVLFWTGAALTAALLSHTSLVFFTIGLLAAFAIPLVRHLRTRDVVAGTAPLLAIPLLYLYFFLTDPHFFANMAGQLAPAQGDVVIGGLLLLLLRGEWGALAEQIALFLRDHAGPLALWLSLPFALLLPRCVRHPLSKASRFFAASYCLLFFVNFLCMKHFVLWYRAIYQAIGYLALACLVQVVIDGVCERIRRPSWANALRCACAMLLFASCVVTVVRFRTQLSAERLPYAQLTGALHYALGESGARPGDRVFVPSPFGFHLKDTYDVIAYPAPKFYRGRWSASFRQGLRQIWGTEAISRVPSQSLCDAMGLAFVRPRFVVAWDGDFSVTWPFYGFLRRYPDLPGMRVTRLGRATMPAVYGGQVRVYRLDFSPAVDALDRTSRVEEQPCP